ncbi:MAG: hypothetical protein HYY14_04630, partial [Candidatus Omnitrophica bacterium]|nr:hypothetical protein [Candidatus Omnitrophota bacterium]
MNSLSSSSVAAALGLQRVVGDGQALSGSKDPVCESPPEADSHVAGGTGNRGSVVPLPSSFLPPPSAFRGDGVAVHYFQGPQGVEELGKARQEINRLFLDLLRVHPVPVGGATQSLRPYFEGQLDPYHERWDLVTGLLQGAFPPVDAESVAWLGRIPEGNGRVGALYLVVRYLDIMENGFLYHGTSINNIESIMRHGLNMQQVPPANQELAIVLTVHRRHGGQTERYIDNISFAGTPNVAIGYAVSGPEHLRLTLGLAEELLALPADHFRTGGPSPEERRALQGFIDRWSGFFKTHEPALVAVPLKSVLPHIDMHRNNRDYRVFLESPLAFARIVEGNWGSDREFETVHQIEGRIHHWMGHFFLDTHTYPREPYPPQDIYAFVHTGDEWRSAGLTSSEVSADPALFKASLERTAPLLKDIKSEAIYDEPDPDFAGMGRNTAAFNGELEGLVRQKYLMSKVGENARGDGVGVLGVSDILSFDTTLPLVHRVIKRVYSELNFPDNAEKILERARRVNRDYWYIQNVERLARFYDPSVGVKIIPLEGDLISQWKDELLKDKELVESAREPNAGEEEVIKSAVHMVLKFHDEIQREYGLNLGDPSRVKVKFADAKRVSGSVSRPRADRTTAARAVWGSDTIVVTDEPLPVQTVTGLIVHELLHFVFPAPTVSPRLEEGMIQYLTEHILLEEGLVFPEASYRFEMMDAKELFTHLGEKVGLRLLAGEDVSRELGVDNMGVFHFLSRGAAPGWLFTALLSKIGNRRDVKEFILTRVMDKELLRYLYVKRTEADEKGKRDLEEAIERIDARLQNQWIMNQELVRDIRGDGLLDAGTVVASVGDLVTKNTVATEDYRLQVDDSAVEAPLVVAYYEGDLNLPSYEGVVAVRLLAPGEGKTGLAGGGVVIAWEDWGAGVAQLEKIAGIVQVFGFKLDVLIKTASIQDVVPRIGSSVAVFYQKVTDSLEGIRAFTQRFKEGHKRRMLEQILYDIAA